MRRTAVVEAERDARIHAVEQRSLSLDPKQLTPALGTLHDEPFRGACDEVGDDGIDGNSPSRNGDASLTCRNEHGLHAASPCVEIELE